jgi:anti-sigma regulatory factor (Ser/Thr protein kinase)
MPTVAPVQETGVEYAGFRHEALLYEGDHEFVAAATSFIREAVAVNEPTLVMVPGQKVTRLREQLDTGDVVYFADMHEVGSNPARIIPAWRSFAMAYEGRRLRGIGEPIWPQRSPAELVECQLHESLLNLAFADVPAFRLLCPYDTAALSADVIAEARRSHPFVLAGERPTYSQEYHGLEAVVAPSDDPMPAPPDHATELAFGPGQLAHVRAFVSHHAAGTGLSRARVEDLVTAINELATNSLLYGGAFGSVHIWVDTDGLICEVRDAGTISDPLIGRRSPETDQNGGRGMWMANQLCNLVRVRSSSEGTVVRVHIRHG